MRSLPRPIELPRSAPMVVRCELVVCCATVRLSDCAPDFDEGVLGHARDLEAAERRDGRGGGGIDAHLVAGLDLAEELVGAGAAGSGPLLQAGDQDLALQLVVEVGVARQRIDVEAALGERAVGGDAHRVGPALAQEGVHPLRAMGVADAEADQEARIESIVDAGGRATEVVGERAGIGVAQHAAETAQRTGPRAQRADTIAALDLAGLRQRLALSRARGAARVGHLLAQRIHEHRAAVGVHGAEVGIGLAADGVQRQRALRGVEAGDHPQHRGEVAAGRGEALVERDADGALVGRQRQEARREGGLAAATG